MTREGRPRRTALDCDGVLACWTEHLLRKLDCGVTIKDVYEFSLRNVLRNLKGREVAKRADIICSKSEFTRSQPVLPWARELVELCMAEGDVMVLTSPWASKGWYDARVEWIRELGLHQDNLMAGRLKAWVKADLFVDDKPKNVIEWALDNPDGKAVLLAWPYNEKHDELPSNARRLTPDELLENLRAGRCGW